MKRITSAAGVVATCLFLCGTTSLAVQSSYEDGESTERTALGAKSSEVAKLELVESQHYARPVGAPQDSDADRGCCVWNTADVQCAYANRGYCSTKAAELRVTFDFVKDTSCRQVRACPEQN